MSVTLSTFQDREMKFRVVKLLISSLMVNSGGAEISRQVSLLTSVPALSGLYGTSGICPGP